MTTTITPSLGHGVLDTQAGVGASPGYDAIDRRRFWTGFERGEGVATYGSYRISQRGAGANMSVDVNQDDGAYVRGDAVTLQGLYYVPPHSATINETVAASDPTNPRIDRVILEIQDNTHDASGQNRAQTRVITGTPSGGATLDNLTGAAAVPSSAILLADVLVPAASSTVVDANIRDRRPFTVGVPPLLTDVDQVAAESPCMATLSDNAVDLVHGNHDLRQAAVLIRLPRRIVAATRIRWAYHQNGTTAVTGNYVIGIYDASGRKIIDTGSIAFAGATNSKQVRAETIAATAFEPGLYYVLFGVDTGAGSCGFDGWLTRTLGVAASASPAAAFPNAVLFSATGGITAPQTILGFTDAALNIGDNNNPKVPHVTLSVG